MASIKPIKFEKPDKGYVSRIDFEYIRNACKDKRDRCIVDMLLSTGCRIGELANIKIKDIDMDQKTIHVYGQKTKEHRDVCIDSVAMVSLRMYLEERNADENDHCEYLFVSKKHPVQRMTTDAYRKMLNRLIGDIPQINRNYTPHNFRHSMATFAIRGGVPIEQVSRMLGHHGTDITLTYAEVSDADVRRSHERCFG